MARTLRNHKPRIYLFAIVSKASVEVSIIEVISEAIGGFMFPAIMLFSHMWDMRSAVEDVGECVGCAICIPIVAFVLRVIFVAPAELVKDSAESTINAKSIYPSLVAILLALCSFLVLGLIFSLQFNIDNFTRLARLTVPAKTANPLPNQTSPMRAMPVTESPLPIAPQKAEQAPSPVFNIDFTPTHTGADELAKFQQEQKEKAIADQEAADKRLHDYWTNALPVYDQAILTLRDTLRQRGMNHETVETYPRPSQFLQCLPRSISAEYTDTTLGEIRLSPDTNMDFKVSVMSDSSEQRRLKISCSSGYFIIHPYPNSRSVFLWRLKTVGVEDEERDCPFAQADQTIANGISALIDGQADYLNPKND